MRSLQMNAFNLAQRFVGVAEVPGYDSNPAILAMLRLDESWPKGDDVPWCSAFVNYVAWLMRLPRSKSLRARSWLDVGSSVSLLSAEVGFDVVVLKRGEPPQGHVGFYAGQEGRMVMVLGGNQGDRVSIASFDAVDILGIRRLA